MLQKRWLVLFFCCLLNSGCFLFGPTYVRPLVSVPQHWPHQATIKQEPSANLPALSWWKQFNSPELDQFIQKALCQNNNIQTALVNIDYARSQLAEVKLNWIPNLTALAGFSQFPILGNPGNVVIAYPLYVVNILQLYKQQKSAEARYAASLYASDCARLVVIAQTSASFFTLIAQQENLRLYKQLLNNYHLYLKLTKNQYKSGLTSQDKIVELNTHISQIQSQVALTEHNIVVSKNALHFLFNENPGDIQVKTSFNTLNTNALIPANLPASVLSSRPDVREAEAMLKASNADVGAVTANLLPTLTLGAYLGKGSNINGPIKLGEAYLNTPVVDLPIFAQISASKAKYKTMYINYITTIRQALRDVSNDLSAYTAYSTQLKNNTAALRDEQHHCHLADVRYKHGINDNIEVVQCNIKVDELELRVNQNKLEKMMALITLYQDLGGGFHGS